jgi:RNA polymerase sigma factor (sigma-70 family)
MKRKLSKDMEDDFFYVHDSIVYGAIKRCGISIRHPNYDDFVQIGLLKLVEAYEEFPDSLFDEKYFYQFTGYAFRKIRWALIDEMRREQKREERFTAFPEDYQEWGMFLSADTSEDCLIWQMFESMLHCLTKREQVYLKDAVLNQLNVTEIAKKHNVSRKTVYRWKKIIAKKLAHYRTVLEN